MHFWHNSGFSLLALKIYVWRNKTLRINKETALAQNDNLPTEMVLAAYARSLIFVYIRSCCLAAGGASVYIHITSKPPVILCKSFPFFIFF